MNSLMTVTYENDDFFQNCVFRADQHIGVYTLGESEELSEGDLPGLTVEYTDFGVER